jgi:DNA helicase-2/ATP-dependent DNA helicase PcrA
MSHLSVSELNPAQESAVLHTEGPLLIIAGAGSGKTKTLVHRVARLIENGVQPGQILLLTFTRKAAQEMLKRATLVLDHRCQNVSGGTFHAFSSAVLRRYARVLGYADNFTIMDRSDSEDVIQLIRQDPQYASQGKRFPNKGTLSDIYSKIRNTNQSIESVVSKNFPHFYEFSDQIEQIYHSYIQMKAQIQAMDYDDLLLKMIELLHQSPATRRALQNQFRYIMVDEYQDTNSVQAELVSLLVNDDKNICVVGDDAQSIYSFRGANFKNIMDFPTQYPGTKVVMLEQNYRSTQPILSLTNAIIERAKERYAKALFSARDEGEKPILVELDSDNAQSLFICQKILEYRESGIALNEMAVLMRSGWHSNELELELQGHGIPFVKMGGFKFVEMAHVKDVLALMRVIYNPMDRISWQRVLLLLDGIGPKSAELIWTHVYHHMSAQSQPTGDVFKGKGFYPQLEKLLALVFGMPAGDPTLHLNQVMAFYTPIFKLRYEDFHKRQSDLQSLQTIVTRYPTLEAFLTEMSLEPPDGTQKSVMPNGNDEAPLTLSTIHSAKGLEWKVVFILSAIDGCIPSMQSLDDFGQIEEERRLFYVALTRAKDHLLILKPNLDGSVHAFRNPGFRFSRLSRFLTEGNLDARYVQKWSIGQNRRTFGIQEDIGEITGWSPSNKPRAYRF